MAKKYALLLMIFITTLMVDVSAANWAREVEVNTAEFDPQDPFAIELFAVIEAKNAVNIAVLSEGISEKQPVEDYEMFVDHHGLAGYFSYFLKVNPAITVNFRIIHYYWFHKNKNGPDRRTYFWNAGQTEWI